MSERKNVCVPCLSMSASGVCLSIPVGVVSILGTWFIHWSVEKGLLASTPHAALLHVASSRKQVLGKSFFLSVCLSAWCKALYTISNSRGLLWCHGDKITAPSTLSSHHPGLMAWFYQFVDSRCRSKLRNNNIIFRTVIVVLTVNPVFTGLNFMQGNIITPAVMHTAL